MKQIGLLCLAIVGTGFLPLLTAAEKDSRPNILFCIADDWGWPHAGAYGEPVVQTPAFDRIAREGVLFHHAYISSPSCTPSRNAILTGQWHWRLKGGANLWSRLDQNLKVYPHIFADAGYHTGYWRKSWGPGKLDGKWEKNPPAGKNYRKGFAEFLKARPDGAPFCFWLGASDPHRGYKLGSGRESGMDLARIKLFPFFPDSEEIRSDMADYFFEVQRFDSDVAAAMKLLEETGEAENTIVVVTGDHGMPFPRCKSNVYDCGSRVPLAMRWPGKVKAGQVLNGFVSLTDLAPTFLSAAGLKVPAEMTGKSLLPAVTGGGDAALRTHVLFGKERHVPGQESHLGGYPMRAIRTPEFLYIRNYEPDRWPNGSPNWKRTAFPGAWFADTDNGPTKTYIDANKEKDAIHRRAWNLCFAKRPADELYDLNKDPDQLVNVAGKEEYRAVLQKLSSQLSAELAASGDPRHTEEEVKFDDYPYLGGAPTHPDFVKPNKKKKGNKK